jgi:hydroxyacylglutathione hydrolase
MQRHSYRVFNPARRQKENTDMSPDSEWLGKIRIIWGNRQSRFPYCNSIFVDDRVKAVIDPASRPDALKDLADSGIDLVVNSHYHFDHIMFNYLFPDAEIHIHENDREAMSHKWEFAAKYGAFRVWGAPWINTLIDTVEIGSNKPSEDTSFTYDPAFYRSIGRVDSVYSDGDCFRFGENTAEVIHAPGHSDSMCCFFFPEQSLAYVSDYSVLSEWGPWYGGEDSNIDQFLKSARRLANLDAEHYVTAHDPSILTRDRFLAHLDDFVSVVEKRNIRIQNLARQGLDFDALSHIGFFYKVKYFCIQWVKAWEIMMLIKHLEYLGLDEIIPKRYSGRNL